MSRIFWQQLAAELAAGQPAWLVMVAAHGRGSPGTAGARMYVRPDGSQVGTIGGGIMESRMVQEGIAALAQPPADDAPPRLDRLRHRRRDPHVTAPGESGLICSGWQHNISLALRAERDRKLLEMIAALAAAGSDGSLVVDADGLRCDDSPPDLTFPRVRWQDGARWAYREQFLNRDRLAVIGGGHCGTALGRVMAAVGWHVTLVDHRPDVLASSDADLAEHVVDYRDAAGALDWPMLTDVVVMTPAVDSDIASLAGCIGRPLRFIGVMGSAAKVLAIRKALITEGVTPAEIDRIHAPVGLPMKSDTPEEIAISVAAQLLSQAKNAR